MLIKYSSVLTDDEVIITYKTLSMRIDEIELLG
jgi:hypothetical protein